MRPLPLLVALLLASPQEVERVKIYDPDPGHLWNRLYATLCVRNSPDRARSGYDRVDPLIWSETRHLLEGASHAPALAILDEALTRHAERLVADPLRRALLQRDLWALFEWTPYDNSDKDPAKRALRLRLGALIGRLALTEQELKKLPDTYAAALASGTFATAYDPKNPLQPFLPPDLFEEGGAWVCLQREDREPAALTHALDFSGRSVFLVFLKLPGGRDATLEWLKDRRGNLPPGTMAALVRRVLALDSTGELRPTKIVERVQLRVYRAEPRTYQFNDREIGTHQDTFEFNLSRERLFENKAGGLVAVGWDDRDFMTPFRVHREDDFASESPGVRPPVRKTCVGCHRETASKDNRVTVQSLRYGNGDPPAPSSVKIKEGSPDDEARIAVRWKSRQFTWGLLAGIVESDRSKR